MRLTLSATLAVTLLAQISKANWLVDFYEKGCPAPDGSNDENLDIIWGTAGQPGQELWCIAVAGGRTAIVRGIETDGMKVDIFSERGCDHTKYIETWTEDGCYAVHEGVDVQAVRVLPKGS
ncbi:uncharacterized protein C8A04DRAFT_33253 [Dichotomopilus funicola]|uniref:Uncharacterized protein n=1 Tax=Dichotomopilus funicola TaxID=1934379 RepID=A0AAN6UUN9_9PEZI|nr:hypothetical protein C8A04DRAFT_33253 [Dichotomopilus funicola]